MLNQLKITKLEFIIVTAVLLVVGLEYIFAAVPSYSSYVRYISILLTIVAIQLLIINDYKKKRAKAKDSLIDKNAILNRTFYYDSAIFIALLLGGTGTTFEFDSLYYISIALFLSTMLFSVANIYHVNRVVKSVGSDCKKCEAKNCITTSSDSKYSFLLRVLALFVVAIAVVGIYRLVYLHFNPPRNIEGGTFIAFLFLMITAVIYIPVLPVIIPMLILWRTELFLDSILFFLMILFTIIILGYRVCIRKSWQLSCSECNYQDSI